SAGDRHAGVAVPEQDHLVEILADQRVDDVGDMRLKVHSRTGQVDPVAQASQAERVDVVAHVAQPTGHVFPAPGPKPAAAYQDVGCHLALPALRLLTGET